jgi:hypothetical protein
MFSRYAGLALAVFAATFFTIGCHQHPKPSMAHPERVDQLLADMRSTSPHVREDAAAGLGSMGAAADREDVVSYLSNGLQDQKAPVRMASAKALRQIGSYRALARLRDASNGGWIEAREQYLGATKNLRSQMRDGNQGARAMLERLGEKVTLE